MRRSGNYKAISCLLFLFVWFAPQLTCAGDFGVAVKKAELAVENDWYVVNAEVDFQLSRVAIEAMNSGIPLTWNVRIRIQKERSLLWNKTVFDKILPYQIRYYPLLSIYQFKGQENEESSSFITLARALETMGKIRGVRLFKKDLLQKNNDYLASIRVQFDREALPLPLRPISYFDSSWNLSSDWLLWPVQVNIRTESTGS